MVICKQIDFKCQKAKLYDIHQEENTFKLYHENG